MAQWLAGEDITAGRLSTYPDATTLTDGSTAAGTWEDWGDETITVANPGIPVDVAATVTGGMINGQVESPNSAIRVAISLDGGTTFTTGNEPDSRVGDEAGAASRQAIAAEHFDSGTPTGDVVVKAQRRGGTTNVTFRAGLLKAEVIPQ